MKWGSGKKNKPLPSPSCSSCSSSSSSSRPSLISHVFPSTWLSKFKQKSGDSELKPSYVKRKGKRNSPSFGSPRRTSGRFYGDDDGDDGFWRLSFGEDSAEGEKKRRDSLRSAPFDSDDEFAGSSRKMEEGREESQKLKGMNKSRNADEWKMKEWLELEREAGKPEEERSTKRGQDGVLEMLGARTIGTKVKDNKHGLITASGARKHHFVSSLNSRNRTLNTIEEEASNWENEEVAGGKKTPGWKKLKERKIEEVTAKSENHRKSVYASRELQRRRPKRSNKVRVCSPRTASRVEICKIKALEDMAKAKMKTKKAAKGRKVQQVRTSLDSFAVVKCSFDPQQDFRDSMVEMIVEKKITGPDDLEELLACYLTLNSDEYHDLIIKVFRQVWFELNQACFGSELQNQHCCND